MNITRHWSLRDKYVDCITYPDPVTRGEPRRLFFNVAALCPECGDVWARIFHTTDEEERTRVEWIAHLRPCPSHGAGTLLDHYFRYNLPLATIVEWTPPGLLQWDAKQRRKTTETSDAIAK